jgi:hypothetical protein
MEDTSERYREIGGPTMRGPDRSEVGVACEQVDAEQLGAMLRGVLDEIDAGEWTPRRCFVRGSRLTSAGLSYEQIGASCYFRG